VSISTCIRDESVRKNDVLTTHPLFVLYHQSIQAWYAVEEEEDTEEEGVEPMCMVLYHLSGKCNRFFNADETYSESAGGKGGMQSSAQYANNDMVCDYIDSLKSNTYDEEGEVILNKPLSWSTFKSQIQAQSGAVKPGLQAGLVLSVLATVGMAVYAVVLHGLLARKNIPWWRQKGQYPADSPHQDSGTESHHSLSAPSTTPLV